ncbi:MAG: ribonuclease D [Acidobacteria bacterium]|nr:ribonuclease D [Acidobacteriota bacterium]
MSGSPFTDEWSVITSNVELKAHCSRWSVTEIIGIDTEFIRERTYRPCPALIQVADSHGIALIDPLTISDFNPLKDILLDSSVVKLMHACDEDLEVLELLTGVTVSNAFDTQLAAAFAGYGFSLGYRPLLETLLHVALDKDQTRSDWLKRPLSSSQLRYAALDVAYLLTIHNRLSRELETLGRSDWLKEEFEHRRRARSVDNLQEAAYLRIRGRGTLKPTQRVVLRALCQWREIEAMARNIPRRHLLRDEVLLKLASHSTSDTSSLRKIIGLSEKVRTRYGETLAACVTSARANLPTDSDNHLSLRPYANQLKRWKEITRTKAQDNNLPPELLANQRALETLLISLMKTPAHIPTVFQGWRFKVITETLLNNISDSSSLASAIPPKH